MIRYYKTLEDGYLHTITTPRPGCWVVVEEPSEEEVDLLKEKYRLPQSFLKSTLDAQERSHVREGKDSCLIVLNMPVERDTAEENQLQFYTLPISFILTDECVITITTHESSLLKKIIQESYERKTLDTAKPLHFFLSLTYQVANHFIMHLENIDRVAFQAGHNISQSMKNDELLRLLDLEKSLVYFTTALTATQSSLEHIQSGFPFPLSQEDKFLLEDILIEIRQSISTAATYTQVLSSTMDTVASMISNNMNVLMKVLTSVTLVISIPNIIFGFYGMNVSFLLDDLTYIRPMITALFIMGTTSLVLFIGGFFKS